jgi:hypothetical protein
MAVHVAGQHRPGTRLLRRRASRIAAGLIPALLGKAAAGMATTVLVAFGGAMTAILAVVVAVKTILVSLLTEDYMAVLERADGGLDSALRPYAVVAWVCGASAFLCLAAAVAWPAIPSREVWLMWIAFGVPAALTGWGAAGLRPARIAQQLPCAAASGAFGGGPRGAPPHQGLLADLIE